MVNILRAIFFIVAVACVYFLGGGVWFFSGLMLGWLWAVLEVAAMSRHDAQDDDS